MRKRWFSCFGWGRFLCEKDSFLGVAPPPTPSPLAGRGLCFGGLRPRFPFLAGLRPCTPLFGGYAPLPPLLWGLCHISPFFRNSAPFISGNSAPFISGNSAPFISGNSAPFISFWGVVPPCPLQYSPPPLKGEGREGSTKAHPPFRHKANWGIGVICSSAQALTVTNLEHCRMRTGAASRCLGEGLAKARRPLHAVHWAASVIRSPAQALTVTNLEHHGMRTGAQALRRHAAWENLGFLKISQLFFQKNAFTPFSNLAFCGIIVI